MPEAELGFAARGVRSFLVGPFQSLARHAPLLRRTIPDAIRRRYAGQVVGVAWLVLTPLLLLGLYSVIYLVIFRVRPVALAPGEYVLYMLSGLIPFLGFVEALSVGTGSLSTDRTVLLNTVFPPELLPAQAVLASHAGTFFGLIAVGILAVLMGKASAYLLLLPVVLLVQLLFVTGLVWVLSLASLVFRDIQHILTFATLALLVVTPIAYTLDMVPKNVQALVYLNPLAYFVIAFHDLVALGRLPDWPVAVGAVALALFSFCTGFAVFQRAKLVFFDYA